MKFGVGRMLQATTLNPALIGIPCSSLHVLENLCHQEAPSRGSCDPSKAFLFFGFFGLWPNSVLLLFQFVGQGFGATESASLTAVAFKPLVP